MNLILGECLIVIKVNYGIIFGHTHTHPLSKEKKTLSEKRQNPEQFPLVLCKMPGVFGHSDTLYLRVNCPSPLLRYFGFREYKYVTECAACGGTTTMRRANRLACKVRVDIH